ncbi:MAG: ATP-binding protein, partial [Phycisphaerae bacterium]|jgi:two-component system phosphate regulon sensor histidine kinase PhoR|nr:ATP-binding protein [Phycisphaerae bacterium]
MVVEVADNGPGIPSAEVGKIFEKFYRVRANSETVRGTGLGLALVKQIIEAIHKGKIDVESRVGAGSVFYIHLPMATPRQNAQAAMAPPASVEPMRAPAVATAGRDAW